MDFTLPEEIAAFADTVARFVETEITPAMVAYEASGEFPRELVEKMGAAGFFGAAFPEDLGGTNVGFVAVAAISEAISRVAPEFGYCMNMQGMTCPFTIFNWGTDAQIADFVPDLIAGKRIGMFALTEPGGGSDGNFTGALGIPTLDGLGADGKGAHTHDEFIYYSSLEDRAKLMLGLFEALD